MPQHFQQCYLNSPCFLPCYQTNPLPPRPSTSPSKIVFLLLLYKKLSVRKLQQRCLHFHVITTCSLRPPPQMSYYERNGGHYNVFFICIRSCMCTHSTMSILPQSVVGKSTAGNSHVLIQKQKILSSDYSGFERICPTPKCSQEQMQYYKQRNRVA